MKNSTSRLGGQTVVLSDKVAEILANLPPKMAEWIRRDTLRMVRDSHDLRRQTWKRGRDRRGRWTNYIDR